MKINMSNKTIDAHIYVCSLHSNNKLTYRLMYSLQKKQVYCFVHNELTSLLQKKTSILYMFKVNNGCNIHYDNFKIESFLLHVQYR